MKPRTARHIPVVGLRAVGRTGLPHLSWRGSAGSEVTWLFVLVLRNLGNPGLTCGQRRLLVLPRLIPHGLCPRGVLTSEGRTWSCALSVPFPRVLHAE